MKASFELDETPHPTASCRQLLPQGEQEGDAISVLNFVYIA
jgi:hypothetical protein